MDTAYSTFQLVLFKLEQRLDKQLACLRMDYEGF